MLSLFLPSAREVSPIKLIHPFGLAMESCSTDVSGVGYVSSGLYLYRFNVNRRGSMHQLPRLLLIRYRIAVKPPPLSV